MLIISLFLLACNILFIGYFRPFNSDDIYWQQVVRTWVPFSGEIMYTGADNTYTSKMPFFYIMEHLFGASRYLAIFETFLLTAFAFTSAYVTALYFLKKLKVKVTYVTLLPFLWLSTFGYAMVDNYLNVNWRTADMGISFLTYLAVAAITFGDLKPLNSIRSKILSIAALVIIGATVASDPYFIYFTIIPIIVMAIVLYFYKRIQRRELILITGGAILSVIISKIIESILSIAGVVVVTSPPSAFVDFSNIVTNIVASLNGLLILYGADFFGMPTEALVAGLMLNALLLISIVVLSIRTLKGVIKGKDERPRLIKLWIAFFAFIPIFIFLVYTPSTLALVSNYRFFMLFVFASIVLLTLFISGLRNKNWKTILALLLILASVFNLGYTTLLRERSILGYPLVAANKSNSLNYELINTMESKGIAKGYTTFWQGNINTYLSEGRITSLAVICIDGVTIPFRWNVDAALYDRPAERTFYLHDPSFVTPATCTLEQVKTQFGEPAESVQVQDKTFLIYDYDIYKRMPSSAN